MTSKFKRGVNLSHWLSQCDLSDRHHLDNAVKTIDLKRLADAGADHVRLPVDYKLIETEKDSLDASGLRYIDLAFQYCKDAGLAMLLDLHSAPGMNFSTPEENSIWNREDLQNRFAQIWTGLSRHFGESDLETLAFELLNEPTAKNNQDWNRIATIGYEAVRSISRQRLIFIGSNSWQSPYTFPDLKVFDDARVVYSFHFYEPFIFTHQKASWVANLKRLDMDMEYPAVVPDLEKEANAMPDLSMREQTLIYSGQKLDYERLRKTIGAVIDFKEKTGMEVYCSEFGVINTASDQSRINWYSDVIRLFGKYNISWSLWDYMGTFGIFNKDYSPKPETAIIFAPLSDPRKSNTY